MSELAARLAMPQATLYHWIQRGVVEARKVRVLTHTLWLIRADEAELERLRHRRRHNT